jgi:hypothetical protein
MDPKIWGSYIWHSLHYIALGYPENPSNTDKANYGAFYKSLCGILPCTKCCKNYEQHLKEIPIEPYLDSPAKLFEWTVNVHNIVNREHGKVEWSPERAKAHLIQGGDLVSQCQPWKLVCYAATGIAAVAGVYWLYITFFKRTDSPAINIHKSRLKRGGKASAKI